MVVEKSESVDVDLIVNYIANLDPLKGEYTIAHNPIIPQILESIFDYKPRYTLIQNESGELLGFMNGVMFNGKYISVPHFSYGGAATNNIQVAKELESSINGRFEIRSFRKVSSFFSEDKVTSYLNLSLTFDDYFNSLKYNIRRQIRIANENNIIIKFGGLDLLDDFFCVYSKNMSRLGSPPQPKYFFEAFLKKWDSGEVLIFCAYIDNMPVGCSFLLSFGGIIENCWAATLVEYNKYFVPYLLYYNIIKYSFNQKYKVFSFGRSSVDSGSLMFKKHWKPVIVPIYFNYQNMNSGIVHKLKGNVKLVNVFKKHIPENVNNLIGKIITKYVY